MITAKCRVSHTYAGKGAPVPFFQSFTKDRRIKIFSIPNRSTELLGVRDTLGGHLTEDIDFLLNFFPLARVTFRIDGRAGIGVVSKDVLAKAEGRLRVIRRHAANELRVGLVGETIGAGFGGVAGVEVEVGNFELVFADVLQLVEKLGVLGRRAIDAGDILLLGVGVGAADGEIGKRSDFGQNEDDHREDAGEEAGLVLAIRLPVRGSVGGFESVDVLLEIRIVFVGGKALAMQEDFGIADAWQQGAHGPFVGVKRGRFRAGNAAQRDAVGVVKGAGKQRQRNLEAHMAEIAGGREARMPELIDVEGELGADVRVGILFVRDDRAVLRFEPGKFQWDGNVNRVAMADRIANVVGERAKREGQLVDVVRFVNQVGDEVAGADVMGEIAEEPVAKGIVARVLDGGSAIGVGASFTKLGGRGVGVAAEKQRLDGRVPRDIDESFVSEKGISVAERGDQQPQNQNEQEFSRHAWRTV